jgi:hypothetical protein
MPITLRYVTRDEYAELFPEGEASDSELSQAEYDVDALTFNRVRAAGGISELTELQQELVKRAVCLQADFRRDYADLLDNPLSSYGINGVSMQWDRSVLIQEGPVRTTSAVVSLLQQTGLTYRGLERRRFS